MRSFGAALNQYLSPPDDEGPCECCGYSVDDCVCPQCEICGEQGNPACYQVVDVEGFDFDICTGAMPNPSKSYKRRKCAKKIMAVVPALEFNREQLKGQTLRKIEDLQNQIAEHRMYLDGLDREAF